MIEIKLQIDDIDYDTAIDVLLPVLADQMAKGTENPMLRRLFTGGQKLSASAAKSFISIMPKEKKDELVVKYINSNKADVSKKLMQLGAKNNVHLKIKDIKASSK